ncbi:MAG: hypothetical protein LC109_02440 [Bacteroidia bacterium]|nr:hypothetical protein [Bacteroidia bacterium]
MYKHIVKYRHKTKEGNTTSMKTLEFELDKQLYYDGPGEWKVICANMITSKTGINTSWIYLDDGTMEMKCLGKVQNNDTVSSSKKETHSTQGNNTGSSLGNLASGVGSGVGSAISGTLSGVGSLAGKGWDSLNKELDKGVEDNKRKRQAIEEKANEISKIEFGTTANEIQSQLEQLIAYGNTLSSEQTPIKKAVYSKVTFGIMRLKSLGANDIASFFEAQSKKIKPNLWNTIWFWATFSNT